MQSFENDFSLYNTNNEQQPKKRYSDREVLFIPPWETKIGQLQQVVRTIQRNSDAVLDNRGAVIVRCYPYRSGTYMHLVYNLIYATLASNAQFGPAQSPNEIRPILLNYNTQQSASNPSVVGPQAAAFTSGVLHFGQQQQWTDFVLIRVHFSSHEPAMCFMQSFNRSVVRVFDRRQMRMPFCHSDLTRPERVLRNHLQQLCDEKNSGANNRAPTHQGQQQYRGRFFSFAPRYYHNGFQMYKVYGPSLFSKIMNLFLSIKDFSSGRVELVPWEQFSESQYLHVLVASLRKFAAMYKQKECFVIIQNVAEHTGSSEADMERITSVVYSIVSTEAYRQRCIHIKQKLELFKNAATGTFADQQQHAYATAGAPPFSHASNHLPQRIERLPRRTGGASRAATAQHGQQKKGVGDAQKQQKEGHSAGGEGKETMATRPPLIRVQFRVREAAIAFCQMFKEHQMVLHQKRREQQQMSGKDNDEGATQQNAKGNDCDGEDQTDSYSDLSDLDVFSSSEGGDEAADHHQQQQQRKKNAHKDDGGVKATGEKKKKKLQNHRQQHSLDTFITAAFAHRDLTPPELALGYALRQHCRNDSANKRYYVFPRAGRVFERLDG
ncbi:hypothetical protein GPALN_004985 [Globodera pallida]|nr:hypothetical protein GPALN_004985 [Globodera pallida]